MNILFVSAAVAVFGLGIFFYWRNRGSKTGHKSAPKTRASHQSQADSAYWGVQFKVPDPEKCCPQALSLQNAQFPKEQARQIPLRGCNQTTCRCYYEKLPERRSGKERRQREDRRAAIRFEDKPDRRSHVDRRKSSSIWQDGHD